MRIHQTPASLMRSQLERFQKSKQTLKTVHLELVRGGVQDHALYTAGRISERELRLLGHPFGRLGGAGTDTGIRGLAKKRHRYKLTDLQKKKGNRVRKGFLDPLPINRQSGALRASFFKTAPRGPQMKVTMGFTEPYAKHVLSPTGTSKMVARGFYSKRPNKPPLSDMGILAKRHRARSAAAVQAARLKLRNN